MNYPQALALLKIHAGLSDTDNTGIVAALNDLEFHGKPVNWETHADEILGALQEVNHYLNTDFPDKVVYKDKKPDIDRELALTVQGILCSIFNLSLINGIGNENIVEARKLHYQLSTLWYMILGGGDFDDIKQEAEYLALAFNSKNENN